MLFNHNPFQGRLLVALTIAFLIMVIKVSTREDETQPVDTPVAPIESNDFAGIQTGGYKQVTVSFRVEQKFPPPLPEHDETDNVKRFLFTAEDYDEATGTYSRTVDVSDVKIAQFKADLTANRYANHRLQIVDPEREHWAYFGRLTVDYGDESQPLQIIDEEHRAWVVAAESVPKTD